MEEIGRTRPTIVAELMEQVNKFADEEDAYNNKSGCSPEVDRGDDTAAGVTKKGEVR
jgi:hypothetical protein